MKKKLLTILLLAALSASSVACGDNEPKDNNPSISSEETSSTPSEKESDNETVSDKEGEADSTPADDPQEKTEKTLADIENYLLDKGVLSGERIQMAAELVGGLDGFKYKDSIGEIYEFDTSSDEYQKLAAGEAIPLEGMAGFTITAVAVNGKFVLLGDDVPQELIDAFNSYE